jgi:hypothetical protein
MTFAKGVSMDLSRSTHDPPHTGRERDQRRQFSLKERSSRGGGIDRRRVAGADEGPRAVL